MYAVYPAAVSAELAQFLDLGGFAWKPVANAADVAAGAPADGWGGAIIRLDGGTAHPAGRTRTGNTRTDSTHAGSSEGAGNEGAWTVARALREHAGAKLRVLVLVRGSALDELTRRDDLFDDFCLDPFHPRELEARLAHLTASSVAGSASVSPEIIEYGPLRINLDTYEAVVEARPLDLTYMEYELLRFLASQPGRVFTREALLNQVWGYEYYGGARTVDVHIRRLRSKLGEENADLIATVRSVGYRLGTYTWR
ncbi:winged helix-turn-helix transcriptional regulator [Candidatus Poriferisodalis sp.]|uniref:winged helix-turn-helix transcriptional regulator n=1 Tax=Candidatus Poriferisodalis sp. TaxID=3101277 RepID=UPI003B02D1C7